MTKMHENLDSVAHCKYVQRNYSEDTSKNCKNELQWFTVLCTSICHTGYMQKCRWYNNPLYFKFTVISLHLEQQLHVENTVENCKLDYSALQWFTVLCTIVSICPIFVVQWKYLPCIKRRKARMPYICIL